MMNRAEQKLVLELCRCHNPNTKQIENLKKQGVDEAVVLGQLLFHRVAGTAYMTLSNTGLLSLFHREFRTTLRQKNNEIFRLSSCVLVENSSPVISPFGGYPPPLHSTLSD